MQKMLIGILLIFISLFLTVPSVFSVLISGQILKIVINQSSNGQLTVGSVDIEDGFPYDYRINPLQNYYYFKILDSKENVLFSGKFVYKDEKMFMVVKGSKNVAPIITLPDTLELRLPYYDQAKEVDILDENSNLKLKINLSDYIKPTITQQESGNPPSNISFMGIKLGRINPTQSFQMIWNFINKIIGL